MKKFKTKNLLFTALLLAFSVLIAVSVYFMLPRKFKTANAAVALNSSVYNSTFIGQHCVLGNNNSRVYSDFSTTINPSLSQINHSGNSFHITKELERYSIASYIQFTADIVVPANTEYQVEYSYELTLDRVSAITTGEANCVIELFYFGNSANGGTDQSASIVYNVLGTSGSPYSVNGYSTDMPDHKALKGTLPAITYKNTTNTDQTFTAYFGYFGGSGRTGGPTALISATYDLVMDEKVTAEKAVVTVDKNSDVYNPLGNNFVFSYDQSKIELKSVDYTDFAGTTSNLYNGSGTSPINSLGNCTLIGAGTYKFEFDIINGSVWDTVTNDQTPKTITVTVNRKAIAVPTIQNNNQTYKASVCEFGLTGYDSTLMSVASYVSNNGSTITWDGTTKKFKATDAAEYTVAFHMDSINHVWLTDAGTESSTDQTKKITIEKKEITINTTPASGTNPSWGLGDTGDITINATATGITNPDFVLDIYYVKDGTTSPLTLGIDTTTNKLDVSQITSTGKYKLCIELTSAASNKNYSIASGKFEMPFEIKSGGIDFSVINWQYAEDGGNMQDLFASGVQNVIRYKQDASGAVVKYIIGAIIPAGGYLSIDTSYNSGGYTNGFYTTKDGATYNSGCSAVGKYKTRIALKTDADHLFKNDAANKYGTFGGDDTSGWYEIEWEISKGKVDASYLSNLKDNLQYRTAGGAWQTYDPANPPQFGKGAIEIRLDPSKYPAGVTNASITVNDKNTAIGSYTAQVTLTYDPNYVNEGTQSFTWEISAQVIEVDWTSDFWKDGSGNNVLDGNNVPYQIKVLNIPDNLKQYIEYKYYIADASDPSVRGMYIGTGDQGLQDLTSPPYNASSTNAVYVYVEAVIKSGVTQYKLSDTTGNAYDCSILYRLGSTNTLVNVTQSVTEMEYGDGALTEGIFTLYDTGIGGDLDKTTYLDGIYVYDAKGTNLGLLSGFDGTKADAGLYTIEIKLNAAGENTYTLAPGSKYKFEIKPKAIDVPTVSEIVFDNTYINLADKLGGSYGTYKDIIKLGGTYDGVKNANTPYVATLTLTNANYCWSYPTTSTPSKHPARLTLTDGESYTVTGDETVATYNWKINPYVLSASGWNLKGKDGATYDIPAGLTEGLDVGINYAYRTDKASNPIEEVILKGGSTFFVTAQLTGADANNFVFEDSNATTSGFATYKIPQSGAMAAFGSIKDFMTKTWLGLPIWAWFLIGLAVLILLIIIIVVAAKRRKTKEERAEKKAAKQAAKEEAEARKEAERARLESEREAERMRLESQREIEKMRAEAEAAKAKAEAEAEIAKMRAQAQAQMAQPMAMPQQMPMQQPQMQQYAQQQAMPQQMPQPVPQPQYVQQPVYGPMPQSGGDLAELKAEFKKMREEQRSDVKLENELLKLRLDVKADNSASGRYQQAPAFVQQPVYPQMSAFGSQPVYPQMPVFPQIQQQSGVNSDDSALAEKFGIMMAAMMRSIGATAQAASVPQIKEEAQPQVIQTETAPVTQPAVYPPDAVITTTTTVDTTKNQVKSQSREESERDRFFDIDGFYDKFEG